VRFVIIDGGSGRCRHLGGHYQGCWGSSMSVTRQPCPVWFGVQEVKGKEIEGSLTWVAYNGGLLLLTNTTSSHNHKSASVTTIVLVVQILDITHVSLSRKDKRLIY